MKAAEEERYKYGKDIMPKPTCRTYRNTKELLFSSSFCSNERSKKWYTKHLK